MRKKRRGALAIAREPSAYDGGLRPAEGGDWLVGGDAWPGNPRLVITEPWQAFVRLWAACRGGMGGIAHWPDAGGVNDQAAWVVDGFAVLAGAEAVIESDRRKLGSG
jgi:hypothetical protein